jgi:MerR family transcriptional regulator, light-induced transcriptional regulator
VYLLLKQRGLPVLYLGANVPQRDVVYITGRVRPQYLYIHLTTLPPRQSFSKFLSAVCAPFQGQSLILSGQGTDRRRAALPEEVITLNSMGAVLEFIDRL